MPFLPPGLLLLAGLAAFTLLGPLHENPVPCAVGLALASLAWMGAVYLAASGVHRPGLGFVFVGAILLRVIAFVGEPELSDDVYRYVWEGEVLASGTSPYVHAPNDPELTALVARIPEVHARLNNPEISAAYPPAAQYVHAGVTGMAHGGRSTPGLRGVQAMRVFYALCDLALIPLLAALLRRRGKPVALVIVWAWSPLVALEFAGSGHFDSLAILLLFLGLERLSRPGLRPGPLGLGFCVAGGLVKLLPFLALPFALRDRGDPRRVGLGLAWVLGFVALAYVPVLWIGGGMDGLFAGLGQYGRRWEGGSLVFRFVDDFVRSFRLPFQLDPQLTGRRIVGLAWVACIAWAFYRRLPLIDACGLCLAGFLVFTPTLHPWYVTWILPFIALRPRAAWVWLAGAAFVLYAPLPGWAAEGIWIEPPWVWPLLAIPFFGLLGFDAWRRRPATARASTP